MSRTCIVTPDLAGPSRNGGIGTHCLHLARFLRRRGDRVTIVHTGHVDDPDLDAWRAFYRQDCGAEVLFISELPNEPSVHIAPFSPRHTLSHRVYRWLASKEFSTIHFQDWQGNGAVTLRAKHTGRAFQDTLITVTAHGSSEWIREGMGEFPSFGSESLFDDALERTAVELADLLICPSAHIRDWLRDHGWRLPDRVEVVPYVFDTGVAPVGVGSLAPGTLKELVFFGRLETRKGLLPFLDALEILAADNGFPSLQVTFLGRHHETLRGSSEDLIAAFSSGFGRRFAARAITDLDQLGALSFLREHRSALVVTPSLADNLPFAVLECLSHGIPLLASNRGGIPELVGDPKHLVEPDAASIARRLREIATEGLPAPAAVYSLEMARERWERVAATQPPRPDSEPKRPTVSIIVPHYEHARELQETIEALERQSLVPDEVIVIDDGSKSRETTDALASIEKRLTARGWRLIRAQHEGPAAARNLGAREAIGEALLLVDADNPPNKRLVESLVTAMTASGAGVVTSAFWVIPADKPDAKPEYLFCPLGPHEAPATLTNTLGDTNMIIRRDVFLELGGFETADFSAPEDWLLLLKAVRRGVPMAVVPDPLFNYRISKFSRARSSSELAAATSALAAVGETDRRLVTQLAQTVRGTYARMKKVLDRNEVVTRQLEMMKAETGAQTERFRAAIAELSSQHKQESDNAHRTLVQLERDRFQLEEKFRESEAQLLVAKHNVLRREAVIIQHADKIQRMQDSFSWKSTAVLRSLRRVLFDRFSKPQPLEPLVQAAGVPSAIGTPATPEQPTTIAPSTRVLYAIDTPSIWHEMRVRRFTIRGWALRRDRMPVDVIRVRCGTDVFEGRIRIRRTDVFAIAPDHPYTSTAGFEVDVRLMGNSGELFLESRTQEEPWECFFRTKWTTAADAQESSPNLYEAWIRKNENLSSKALHALTANIDTWPFRPLISVVMPVYNTPARWLIAAIESVRSQAYGRWELCIADDASPAPHIRPLLEDYQKLDDRIRVVFRTENGHIAAASNSALEAASGEWTVFLDHDDTLAPHALAEIARTTLANPDAGLIYSDEDKIDEQGMRFDPYFKSSWMPDLFLGQNYVTHLAAYRTDRIRKVGGFRLGLDGSQDWDLALRIIEQIPHDSIVHIPKVLYHWRAIPGSTAAGVTEKNYSVESAKRAIADHFERTGVNAEIIGVTGEHWRIRHPCPNPEPRVSLIIPTRDKVELLRQFVGSLLGTTAYGNYEIVIVDNESQEKETHDWFREISGDKVRVIPYHKPFNYSALNNFAVTQTSGDIIGFLNNDLEVMNGDWLREMVSQACRPGAGCVGALLYYPDETVQHAGVLLGVGGVAGHAFMRYVRGTDGYFNRLRLVQNYSAVTAASMVMKREVFTSVGGFNETDLAVAFNDVDLCLRVRKAGYLNIWTPFAEFIHHESASRGPEDTPEKQRRFGREIGYMRRVWGAELDDDPAYSPHLSLDFPDFSIASPPRPFIG